MSDEESSADHFFEDLGRSADHDRATGSKEIVLHRFFPSPCAAQVDPEQVPAHNTAVHGFKAAHKLFDEVVSLETGFFFTRRIADRETQDHKGSGDRSAVASHAHACTEPAPQFEGRLRFQAEGLAEAGKDGLCSGVTLIKERNRFFDGVHWVPPW